MRSFKGLWVALALLAMAGCGGAERGTERGVCFPNGTCNAGLTCLSNVCVAAGGDSSAVETGADAAGADAGAEASTNVDASAEAALTDAPALDTPAAAPDVTTRTEAGADAASDAGGPDVARVDDGGRPCPGADIFHPGMEMRMVNTSVPFVGRGRTETCAALTGAALVWTDSLEGPIGTGEMFNFTFRMRGSHTVTLTATYGGGRTTTVTVTFPLN